MLTQQITNVASKAILRRSCRPTTQMTTVRLMSSTVQSPWNNYVMAPLDPIIGLTESYLADKFPNKVNVGVGAYRCENGKPYVLPCVQKAEKILVDSNLDMEYSGIVSLIYIYMYNIYINKNICIHL